MVAAAFLMFTATVQAAPSPKTVYSSVSASKTWTQWCRTNQHCLKMHPWTARTNKHIRYEHWASWCRNHDKCYNSHQELHPKGYWVSAFLTAYCPCGGINGGGTTANGTGVYHGEIAAPPQYPFGTRVFIPGYGDAVVEDRGGAIYGNHFDLGEPSYGRAMAEYNYVHPYENIFIYN